MKYYAVITAGGVGKRMKAKVPKQFLDLNGKPILLRTIELFTSLDLPVEIILVLPPSHIDIWKDYYNKHNLYIPHTIVPGGITRFHSVRSALEVVPDGAVVAVHDGVRPIVPKELITELFTYPLGGRCAGVIPAVSVVESMRKREFSQDGSPAGTHPVIRENYMLVQTPQVFDSTRLKLAYKKPYSPTFTDDATVMESSGYEFDIVEGSKFNLKITTKDDLKFAFMLLPED
ncbi:MAG: 2-C-methyl-D-erythritol 4-phosphate cytidylyltransferase [Bacteroidales bacterium]|nr:2-C-methyl-D-erythritol 4-phosphate cytidylyltransferase [Bacteroidales bacterium]